MCTDLMCRISVQWHVYEKLVNVCTLATEKVVGISLVPRPLPAFQCMLKNGLGTRLSWNNVWHKLIFWVRDRQVPSYVTVPFHFACRRLFTAVTPTRGTWDRTGPHSLYSTEPSCSGTRPPPASSSRMERTSTVLRDPGARPLVTEGANPAHR